MDGELPRDATGLLRALMRAYAERRLRDVHALYAPTATHRDVATGRTIEGPDAIVAGLGRFVERMPDARWEVERILGDEAAAACTYRLTATLQEDLGPYVAAGQAVELPGALVLTARDGAIAATADYWDSGTLDRQLRAPAEASR